jgi:hypothetical protein
MAAGAAAMPREFVRTAAQALEQQRRDHEPGGLCHFARRANAPAVALPPEQRKDHTVKKTDFWESRYFKAADDLDQPLVLTIEKVKRETLKNGDREDTKPVAYFEGTEKGLVLNMTNWDSIADIAGDGDTDEWPGVKVELFASTVSVKGEVKACVRVRAPKAKKPVAKPTPKSVGEDINDEIPAEYR